MGIEKDLDVKFNCQFLFHYNKGHAFEDKSEKFEDQDCVKNYKQFQELMTEIRQAVGEFEEGFKYNIKIGLKMETFAQNANPIKECLTNVRVEHPQ